MWCLVQQIVYCSIRSCYSAITMQTDGVILCRVFGWSDGFSTATSLTWLIQTLYWWRDSKLTWLASQIIQECLNRVAIQLTLIILVEKMHSATTFIYFKLALTTENGQSHFTTQSQSVLIRIIFVWDICQINCKIARPQWPLTILPIFVWQLSWQVMHGMIAPGSILGGSQETDVQEGMYYVLCGLEVPCQFGNDNQSDLSLTMSCLFWLVNVKTDKELAWFTMWG